MQRWALLFLAACGGSSQPPAPAPVALDVPPLPPPTSSAPVLVPPADTTKYVDTAPAMASAAPDAVPAASSAPFDKGAAASALASANYKMCAQPGGATGPGHVTVTFSTDGRVAMSVVDLGPYPGTPIGACIAHAYGTVRVPPFAGAPVRVGKSFVLP